MTRIIDPVRAIAERGFAEALELEVGFELIDEVPFSERDYILRFKEREAQDRPPGEAPGNLESHPGHLP